MTDEQALIAEALDIATPTRRLEELIDHSSRTVKVAALANPRHDIRRLATMLNTSGADVRDAAIDAIIARPREFQYVVWDEPRALELIPARLTTKADGDYIVRDDAFEAFARGWNSATAAAISFDVMERESIVNLLLHEDFADEDEEDDS